MSRRGNKDTNDLEMELRMAGRLSHVHLVQRTGHLYRVPFNHVIKEAAQKALRLHAVKSVDDLTRTVRDDGWEALGLMPTCNSHILIRVNLSQNKSACVFGHQPGQHWLQTTTGAAPIGTDIQQYRNLMRTRHNPYVEVSLYYVK
jgi:hypothetical protein